MFKFDWFKGYIINWTKWLAGFKGKPNLQFLEIGCFEGRATTWLLENILTNSSSFITVIDTFEGSLEFTDYQKKDMFEIFSENIKEYRQKVIISKGYSQELLREKKLKYYDFIYIDGSHIAPDVLEDTILAWGLLKVGGIMVFDDYEWHHHKNPLMLPKIAVDSFLEVFKGKYQLIHKGYQLAIKKLYV
jgi:predicted O-methyltransferase YrrM